MAIVINGSGEISGISVGGLPDDIVDAGTLADNAVGLAQMAGGTDGNIITYDTSGNPAAVATGSSGQILTSAGADAVPTFAAAASGGKLLQVVVGEDSTSTTVATGTFTDVGLSATITPASGTKVLVQWTTYYHDANSGGSGSGMRLKRDSTAIYTTTDNNTYMYSSGNLNAIRWQVVHTYLDTHGADGSTAVTYTAQVLAYLSNTLTFNVNNSQTQMVLMEIDS